MLGIFWYAPIPHWSSDRIGQPAFFLEGEANEDLCWDLVDQFVDGFMTQKLFAGRKFSGLLTGPGVMDASELEASMTRLTLYHGARFTEEWCDKHRCVINDYLERPIDEKLPFPVSAWSEHEDLLRFYLEAIIRRYYAPFHGLPESFEPDDVVPYFRDHTYLRFIPMGDKLLLAQVMSGDLSPLY